jgi:phosphatidylglycerol:prolipoprotein diacylglycerol transferase
MSRSLPGGDVTNWLAAIPYPRIDPVIVRFGDVALRWYGVSYVLAFLLAFFVLRDLSRRGRWPIPADRVGDVLFWGILGVFVGGRLGYVLIYMVENKTLASWVEVWKGGMSFHGGLVGVVVAYWLYSVFAKIRFRDLADGLAVAAPPGIFLVRLANFVNAELWGRPWDGPWAMDFPVYDLENGGRWSGKFEGVTRHPSQLYEALGEGLLLFFVMRWLMLKRGVGGGRVACAFLMAYGLVRFAIEFTREPDKQIGYEVFGMTRGQELCIGMILAGIVAWLLLPPSKPAPVEA